MNYKFIIEGFFDQYLFHVKILTHWNLSCLVYTLLKGSNIFTGKGKENFTEYSSGKQAFPKNCNNLSNEIYVYRVNGIIKMY